MRSCEIEERERDLRTDLKIERAQRKKKKKIVQRRWKKYKRGHKKKKRILVFKVFTPHFRIYYD